MSVFLAKARGNLAAARLLAEHGHYDAAANRAYYAAFHAAVAALEAEGLYHEGMGHRAVQAAFGGLLILRRKRYPAALRSVLLDLQETRNTADYGNIRVSGKSRGAAAAEGRGIRTGSHGAGTWRSGL